MPPKGASTLRTPPRLPALRHIRIRRPNENAEVGCVGVMTSLLSCWASAGASMQGCAALEQQLRTCMDERKPGGEVKSNINFHLARLYPKIQGPRKREGVGRKY